GDDEVAPDEGVHLTEVDRLRGDIDFVVLRPAWYDDAAEAVDFGEMHAFVGRDFIVTVRHGEHPNLKAVRDRIEREPELLKLGATAILYAIFDHVVDAYLPVVDGLQNDVDEIEDELFGEAPQGVSRRIYRLSREVSRFQRATDPLSEMLEAVAARGGTDLELQRLLRDVQDHVLALVERLHGLHSMLDSALTVHATIVGQTQNEQVKKISGWAAIAVAPTIIGGIYGMNFRFMPELDWPLGYPFALVLMVAASGGLYLLFKRRGWI
ncbi:MAG: magnesium and cobalt transport protein CorA, partial [Microbacterium sp.]